MMAQQNTETKDTDDLRVTDEEIDILRQQLTGLDAVVQAWSDSIGTKLERAADKRLRNLQPEFFEMHYLRGNSVRAIAGCFQTYTTAEVDGILKDCIQEIADEISRPYEETKELVILQRLLHLIADFDERSEFICNQTG